MSKKKRHSKMTVNDVKEKDKSKSENSKPKTWFTTGNLFAALGLIWRIIWDIINRK